MKARGFVIGTVIAIACVAVGVSAQSTTQGRDTRATTAAPKGSAELAVLVTTDQQPPQPIRRAAVSIRAGELDIPHIGLTDDDGRVVFRDLAAGNYLLTADRPGFVKTYYGSPQPGRGPGVAVTVLEGQHVSGIQLRLLHGGVITGTLRNASGRPAPNQSVRAIMVRNSAGERRAVNEEDANAIMGRQVSTDDRGMYRIFGLPPGEYLISVPLSGIVTEQMRQVTTDELQWADKMVTASGAAANYSAQPNAPAPPEPTQPVAYSPVYFPGTTVAAEATVVTLGPNEERSGVDFGLQLVPTAQLSGRVVDSEGRPQGGQAIQVKPLKSDGLDLFASLLNTTGRTNPDGTFSISGVRPGVYTLTVRATPRTGNEPPPDPRAEAAAMMSGLLGGAGGPGASHWATEDVSVQGVDINGINLVLRPGMTVTGKVVYEATTKTPPSDVTKTMISLLAAPTGTDQNALLGLLIGGGNTAAKVAADGTFTISGVAPGRYRLNTPFGMIPSPMMGGLTGGWTLKSVMAGGRDIADAPIDLKPGVDVSNVVVTFTDHPAELSGTVAEFSDGRVFDRPLILDADVPPRTNGQAIERRPVQGHRPARRRVLRVRGHSRRSHGAVRSRVPRTARRGCDKNHDCGWRKESAAAETRRRLITRLFRSEKFLRSIFRTSGQLCRRSTVC
jgi:hypothetical protein